VHFLFISEFCRAVKLTHVLKALLNPNQPNNNDNKNELIVIKKPLKILMQVQ